jgi:hypothetical protein
MTMTRVARAWTFVMSASLVLWIAAAPADPCQQDVMECQLDLTPGTMNTPKLGGCMCARMSYVLASYSPAPDSGAHSLDTICNWWKLIQQFGRTPRVIGQNYQQCIAISRTMQSSIYYSSNGWVGANASCCALFAPHSLRFREESSQLRVASREGAYASNHHTAQLQRAVTLAEARYPPIFPMPTRAPEFSGMVPPSWKRRDTGRSWLVPPSWKYREGKEDAVKSTDSRVRKMVDDEGKAE